MHFKLLVVKMQYANGKHYYIDDKYPTKVNNQIELAIHLIN